eukprot:10967604-Alexandrium_andersonii.AAC.1
MSGATPDGADLVSVDVPYELITRVVFAFPADGGWYVLVEPYGHGAVRGVVYFKVHFYESQPGRNMWYEPRGRF